MTFTITTTLKDREAVKILNRKLTAFINRFDCEAAFSTSTVNRVCTVTFQFGCDCSGAQARAERIIGRI